MNNIIITIDGWSSCGKSTLARQLAKSLGYVYIDSGAMYRAITLYFLRNHINWVDKNQVTVALDNINIEFRFNNISQQIWCRNFQNERLHVQKQMSQKVKLFVRLLPYNHQWL
mgnify:CR=1 FL=1